ncbi:polysaccharide deacetylase family protein, partial [Streptomyces sp. SID5926]|nr:polysaccharide deacetylase family protein [Streptomyces sp. SID5926]
MRTSTGPRASSRTLRTLASGVAVTALAAAGTVAAGAAPSQAAACNGYVGLTFDDGPSGSTQSLLNALRQNGLRATMFNQGQYAAQNPSLVRAQVDAGMWVANHSYTHPHMTQLGQAQMDSEISRTQQAIAGAGGGTPKLFRPPYGETNATLRSVEAKYGLTEVIWDVDSQDWNNASTDAIVQAVSRLGNGQVILMHDWPANTLAAIPRIAQTLANKGLCSGMISPQTGRAVAPDGSGGGGGDGGGGGGGACTATLSA